MVASEILRSWGNRYDWIKIKSVTIYITSQQRSKATSFSTLNLGVPGFESRAAIASLKNANRFLDTSKLGRIVGYSITSCVLLLSFSSQILSGGLQTGQVCRGNKK